MKGRLFGNFTGDSFRTNNFFSILSEVFKLAKRFVEEFYLAKPKSTLASGCDVRQENKIIDREASQNFWRDILTV
jgi:hypothetical protein